jgi:hypothetical protein
MADVDPPATDAALEALLRDRKYGPPDHEDATPWDFVRRWPDAVARERAWPIISRLLTDDDELVRNRAVELVRVWSATRDLTRARILEVAEQHPALYGDQAPEGLTLRYEMAFALSNGATVDNGPRTAAVLREMATHEPIGGGAATVLGEYEPEFVTAHAPKWGDAQADWIEEAARSIALFRRDDVLPFLRALRGLSEATRTRVLAMVERYIKRDDPTANALARGDQLPPPVEPAPSTDDCKRAIGL